MQSGRWVWLVTALLAAVLCASATHAEERVALVIGNSAYAHLPVLDSPRNDAAAIADKLRHIGSSR